MKRTLTAAALAAITNFCEAAPLDRIRADVLDPNAPRGVIRTFDATKMTVKELRTAAGLLQKGQAVSIWCLGDRMGSGGASAFDVFIGPGNAYGDRGDQINRDLRKLGVTLNMKLVDVCWRNQEDFERRQGIGH